MIEKYFITNYFDQFKHLEDDDNIYSSICV